NRPALKKYGDRRPALVRNSPKRSTPVSTAKRINSARRSSAMCCRGEKEGVVAMIRVVTLNLNGIRSAARRGWIEWANAQRADVVCVQEVRAQECDLDDTHSIDGLRAHFDCGQRKGYSGVGVYARRRP